MTNTQLTITVRAYREIQAQIRALTEEADALKALMIQELDAQQTEHLEVGEYTIHSTRYEASRFDSAKFKADAPAIYNQYITTTSALRFQVA